MPIQPDILWQSTADRDLFTNHGLACFQDVMAFAGGTRICHKRGRSVVRLELEGRAFYLKRNRLHPTEFWKALGRLRWPRLGARCEWDNILAVQFSGIPTVTPVAVGERRWGGVETASFTITEELYDAEPLDVVWRRDFACPRSPKQVRAKIVLLHRLARLARRFHAAGMNHQDFYINHFFLGKGGLLYLLDLQRVACRTKVPCRAVVKDLAQLNYSSRVYGGFSKTDRLRFYKDYLGCSRLDDRGLVLLRRILSKTQRIARHDAKLRERRQRRGELPKGDIV
jgi:heptose I phosphotransferase